MILFHVSTSRLGCRLPVQGKFIVIVRENVKFLVEIYEKNEHLYNLERGLWRFLLILVSWVNTLNELTDHVFEKLDVQKNEI